MAKTAKPQGASLQVVGASAPTEAGEPLGRKEFVAKVAAESGMKPKDARAAVDAVLAALASSLRAGEELNLPPLGKVKHVKAKDIGTARVATIRVRIPEQGPKKAGSDPLAETGEEG
ncbi:HU family DNA-binding protein [Loktanella sp. IMCC34160]|uniref:HU family DNA-binding protein n=1 Tax=Loktanella sp. IMCC34160 TaxID=2510646 RepID=UPI0013ECD433|nr:HU family DNA-binding protein [Loktanella sp. IMCC34160]